MSASTSSGLSLHWLSPSSARRRPEQVRNVHGPTALLDHLVGTYKNCFGNGDPQGLCGLEVHDHLEPRWALDGKVGRSGAAQTPRDITAATAKHIWKVRPIGN